MIAHIQLEWLIFNQQILTDEEAGIIKSKHFQTTDADDYFVHLIERIDNLY
jgi:hypothetical protein